MASSSERSFSSSRTSVWIEQPLVGIFDCFFQVRDPGAGRADHVGAEPCQRLLLLQVNLERQHAFLGAAADRQHAMRWNLCGRFTILRVHLVLAFRIGHALDRTARHDAFGHQHPPHGLAKLRIFADPLRDDMPCAFQSFLRRRHAFVGIDETCSELAERRRVLLIPEELRQRLESLLARDGRFGPSLGLVGKIEIFEIAFFQCRFEARLELRSEFPLLFDGRQHGLAAVLQLTEILQLLLDSANLDLVQVSGGFLTITREEGNRAAVVQQPDRGGQAPQRNVQLPGNVKKNGRREWS